MIGSSGARVVLYKRWLLRDGVEVADVATLVRDEIVPTYALLSGDVALALELCEDARSVLAIQRWRNRSTLVSTMNGNAFDRWWSEYQPLLRRWDALVELDAEWSATELIG